MFIRSWVYWRVSLVASARISSERITQSQTAWNLKKRFVIFIYTFPEGILHNLLDFSYLIGMTHAENLPHLLLSISFIKPLPYLI